MGSVQGQGVREKECEGQRVREREPKSVVVGAWMGRDRLRPTHLRATLSRLLDLEREEWQPSILTHPSSQDGGEVDTCGRGAEVWWVWGACERLGWGHETRFTAVVLLDRLLHRVRVPPRYLHAVAAAAVFLAAKIHEEDENVPATVEVVERGEMRCSWRELLRMERVCLDKLAWRLPYTSTLDLLQVLHALAITTAPRHAHISRSGSPTHQLGQLTLRLWCVVASGGSGRVRPSVLALALLSLELDQAHTPEPGLVLWLQALTQVSDEELLNGRALVEELLQTTTLPTTTTTTPPCQPSCSLPSHPHASTTTHPCPPSRPNKRKVAQSLESEEDMYQDIKKLYAYEKGTGGVASPSKHQHTESQEDMDDTYTDIHRLYTSPIPPQSPLPLSYESLPMPHGPLPMQHNSLQSQESHPQPIESLLTPVSPLLLPQNSAPPPHDPLPPAQASVDLQLTTSSTPATEISVPTSEKAVAPKKRRRRKSKPTFKAKNMKSCLKQALKIPCKISLIATKKIFEEVEEEEEDEEEMEIEEDEGEGIEEEGPLVEPVGLLKSPSSPQ